MEGARALRSRTVIALLATALSHSTSAADLRAPPGASSCSGCHAAFGSLVPSITGRPAGEIVAAMAEYRAGTRDATVMTRIARGFTVEETRAIAAWLEGVR